MPNHNTVAGQLVRFLAGRGVERLFSLSGNQILSVYDACLEQGLEIIHVRHEAAAVHMADAWGRLTGMPGVALLTAGPGHANGLSALYVAREAESPLLLLSGACPAATAPRGGFQAMPQEALAAPVCKAAATLANPSELEPLLDWAWETAIAGRSGPVAVTLPGDLLEALPVLQHGAAPFIPTEPLPAAPETVEPLRQYLAPARRPLMLAGPAFCRGHRAAALELFSRAAGIPAIATESPRGINDPHLGCLAEVLAQADLVLLLAKKLDWSLKFGQPPTFATECTFIQVDSEGHVIEQGRANRGQSANLLSVRCDPLELLAALQEHGQPLVPRIEAGWPELVAEALCWRPRDWTLDAAPHPTSPYRTVADSPGRIHPVDVCLTLREWLRPDDIFISDGGEFGQWAQAVLHTRRRLINGPSGSIGGSLAFALAARLADSQARVVVTLGDGTFGFHAMEFDTAVRYRLPFVAVVGNDARWNAESQLQAKAYGSDRQYGCDLLPTRYDRLVAALGGHGEHVTHLAQLPQALERAFASNLPACVNVDILPAAAPVFRRS